MLEKRLADAPDPESFLTRVNAALQAETRVDVDKIWIELDPEVGILVDQRAGRGHREQAHCDQHCGARSRRQVPARGLMWWAGCERVDNRLEVEPPEEDTDDEITDAVCMVLEKAPLVHATQLRIGTAAAVVEIRGFVASDEERRLAVLDAWYMPGVWEVVDHIEVPGLDGQA